MKISKFYSLVALDQNFQNLPSFELKCSIGIKAYIQKMASFEIFFDRKRLKKQRFSLCCQLVYILKKKHTEC